MDSRTKSSGERLLSRTEAGPGRPTSVTRSGDPSAPVLAARSITKRFGDLVAVDQVDLEVRRGEVLALLGENGAGKTTLMNVLAGFLVPDEGLIEVSGKEMHFAAPRDALVAGIGMVHQHFRLVDKFTVAENLVLGDHDTPRLIDKASLAGRVGEWSDRFGMAIDPNAQVWRLSAGEQQRVEVLRALARGAELLILDEPTSVLTPQETENLCTALRDMASEGRSVVFISHKLNEVLNVSDRVTVMRKGKKIETLDTADCDPDTLAGLMMGKSASAHERESTGERGTARKQEPARGKQDAERDRGGAVLRLDGVNVRDQRGINALRDLTLEVHAGEILGVAGVAGNGQSELATVATGGRRPDSGVVRVNGTDLSGRGPRSFIDAGVAYIPEDRRGTGLLPSLSIWRNAILKSYRSAPVAKGPLLRTRPAKRLAQELTRKVALSTDDIETPVEHLSGGNAQKLLTGRELGSGARVIVAVNPVQGLDVGAAAEVSRTLLVGREQGLAVLLISHDLDELLRISDRIAVLCGGQILGEFPATSADRDRIGLLMGGVTSEERPD